MAASKNNTVITFTLKTLVKRQDSEHHFQLGFYFFLGILLYLLWFLPGALLMEFGYPLMFVIISQDKLRSLHLYV